MTSPVDLSLIFLESQPARAGLVLEDIAPEDAAALAAQAPPEVMAPVLAQMQPSIAVRVLLASPAKTAAQILIRMAPHAQAVLLRGTPDAAKDKILTALPGRQTAALRRHLTYDPGTVGAWMSVSKAVIPVEATVGDALGRLRNLREKSGQRLFVTDKDKKLIGGVDLDALIVANDSEAIVNILRPDTPTLSPYTQLTSIIALDAWDTSLQLPVTNRSDRLLGVLSFDAVREGLAAGRGATNKPHGALIMLQLGEALMVSLAGLAQVATAAPIPRRIEEETP